MLKHMLFIIVALVCCTRVLSQPECNDFGAIDLKASAPDTFNHRKGGGAWNGGANGGDLDLVPSLQGGDWACGDFVTFLTEIDTAQYTHVAPTTLTLHYSFLADTTGQSGVGFIDFGKIQLNYGNVTNGGRTAPIVAPRYVYGKDTIHNVNCDSPFLANCSGPAIRTPMLCTECPNAPRITIDYKNRTAPPFTKGARLLLGVTISGLRPGNRVVLRVDAVLGCYPDPSIKPSGDLQGKLESASCFYPGSAVSAVSGGAQTIPLKSVSNIIGLDQTCVPPNFTGIDFNATVTISDPGTRGGATLNNFYYSWSKGGFVIKGINYNYTELHVYDSKCSPNQAGLLQFNQGVCGCEVTSILTDQPRFFLYNTSEYYIYPPQTVQFNGNTYTVYSNNTEGPVLNLWYWQNGTIYRADLSDGRILVFSNVQLGTVPTALFDAPTNSTQVCNCGRQIDIVMVLDRSFWVSTNAFVNVISFATNIVNQFTISPTKVNIGILFYDVGNTVQLRISDGTSLTNILNSLRAITCPGGRTFCGTNNSPSINSALLAAQGILMSSTRVSTASKAVILLTTGFSASDAAVRATVLNMAQQRIMVVSGVFDNTDLFNDIAYNLAPIEDRYAIELYASAVMVSGNAADYFLQISGTVCLASTTPCGASCCGGCDTTCGQCLAVTSCIADNTNCSSLTIIQGGCCVKSFSLNNCPSGNNCTDVVCDAASGRCRYTSKCPPNNACFNYTCVGDACVAIPLFNDTGYCTGLRCNTATNTIEPYTKTIPCGVTDRCNVVACFENNRTCTSTPIASPVASLLNRCYTSTCDPATGWSTPVNRTQQCISSNNDNCFVATCDLNTGSCETTPKCDLTVTDQCRVPYCEAATGRCLINTTKFDTCASLTNRCQTAFCDPSSGSCVGPTPNVTCFSIDGCNNYTCSVSTGNCTKSTNLPCSCTCRNNACFRSTCVSPTDPTCQNESLPSNCIVPDKCQTFVRCDNSTGCVFEPVVCRAPTECEDFVRDPSVDGCCVYIPKNCSGSNPCYDYVCNVSVAGGCQTNYKCPDSTPCVNSICDPVLGCITSNVTCTPRNRCETATCDAQRGCVFTQIICDDGDNCTTDSCDPTDGCKADPIVCADSELCTVDTCNPATGTCRFQVKSCDDGLGCTRDSCNSTTGNCHYDANDDFCQDTNPCKTWTCNPAADFTVNPAGCVSQDVVCPTSDDLCSTPICYDFQGCGRQPVVCLANSTDSNSCNTASCSNFTGNCTYIYQQCAIIDTAVVLGATIGVAAIVGIVIAVVACLGVAGGASYAAFTRLADNEQHDIQNNPLFVSPDKGGDNPMYDPSGKN